MYGQSSCSPILVDKWNKIGILRHYSCTISTSHKYWTKEGCLKLKHLKCEICSGWHEKVEFLQGRCPQLLTWQYNWRTVRKSRLRHFSACHKELVKRLVDSRFRKFLGSNVLSQLFQFLASISAMEVPNSIWRLGWIVFEPLRSIYFESQYRTGRCGERMVWEVNSCKSLPVKDSGEFFLWSSATFSWRQKNRTQLKIWRANEGVSRLRPYGKKFKDAQKRH